ncbi:TonB-dependent receptor [Nisaea sp.]|uniref:TonB-dependent receptor plug domain-containing protein n=1 Tax=Nisaea sp. TaxID=2024842 RepID=UPI0032653AA9
MSRRVSLSAAASVSAVVTLLCGAPESIAQSTDDKAKAHRLDQIVVSANRREQSIDDVQASIDVIDQEKLQRYSGASLIEALRDAVGVDARSSGSSSDVTIRGQIPNAGSSVLILVDGLPRTAKFGVDNLNLISVENVERIEVVRGPMSALYGANAAGGVINIITKSPEGTGGSIRTTVGTSASDDGDGRETFNTGATAHFSAGQFSHKISVDTRHARPFAFDDDIDDSLNGNAHLGFAYQGRWEITETDQLDLRLEGYDQDDRHTGVSAGQTYTRTEKETRLFGALTYSGNVGPGFLTIEGSRGHTDGSANRSITVEKTDYTQTIAQGRYFLDFDNTAAGSHSVLTGGGIARDEIDINIYSRTGERDDTHFFIQDEWVPLDWLSIVGGVRVDHFSDFGTHAVPRLTIGSRGDGLSWRIGYGQAYRAPSVIEQYSQFVRGRFLIRGNENVEAEESTSYEAALGWSGDRGRIEAVYHHSDIENLIESVTTSERTSDGLGVIEYQNISEAVIQGIELSGEYLLSDEVSIGGSYEFLDAEDGDGKRLEDRARHAFKVSGTYESGPWSATVRGRTALGYYAPDPNIRGSAPFTSEYSTVDLNGRYRLNDDLSFSIGVDNIFDKQVPVNYSSNGSVEDPAGRFVYATMRFAF